VSHDVPAIGLKDSGQRTLFETGAQRETQDKIRLGLVSPWTIELLAKHLERGGLKYPDPRNWENGLPLSTFTEGAQRHLNAMAKGNVDEPHAVAALWNLHCLVHTMHHIAMGMLPKELNDLGYPEGKFSDAWLLEQVGY
jgi:hypothetical protein